MGELPRTYHYTVAYLKEAGDQRSIDCWVKERKQRTDLHQTESGKPTETLIVISDGQFDWLYNPDENMALKFPPGSGMNPGTTYLFWFTWHYYGSLPEDELLAAAQSACDADPSCASVEISGYETILGEKSVIFTWTSTDGSATRGWISTTHGWLLKWQLHNASTGNTETMEFANIDLNPAISDDMFDINAIAPGATIIDMTAL